MSSQSPVVSDAAVAIRGARVSDAEAIARVHLASSEDAYAPLAKVWPKSDLDRRVAQWEAWLRERGPNTVDFVATVDGAVVGFTSGGPAREQLGAETEIYVIHVLPEHRGHGVGGQLWTAACEAIRGPSLRSMYVETFAELRCCSFYGAHGGVVQERTPETFHGGPVTRVFYSWPAGVSSAVGTDRHAGVEPS